MTELYEGSDIYQSLKYALRTMMEDGLEEDMAAATLKEFEHYVGPAMIKAKLAQANIRTTVVNSYRFHNCMLVLNVPNLAVTEKDGLKFDAGAVNIITYKYQETDNELANQWANEGQKECKRGSRRNKARKFGNLST